LAVNVLECCTKALGTPCPSSASPPRPTPSNSDANGRLLGTTASNAQAVLPTENKNKTTNVPSIVTTRADAIPKGDDTVEQLDQPPVQFQRAQPQGHECRVNFGAKDGRRRGPHRPGGGTGSAGKGTTQGGNASGSGRRGRRRHDGETPGGLGGAALLGKSAVRKRGSTEKSRLGNGQGRETIKKALAPRAWYCTCLAGSCNTIMGLAYYFQSVMVLSGCVFRLDSWRIT